MAGQWPQETGQGHGYDRTALEKGEKVQLKEPDKAGKRQPRLTPGRENGNSGSRIYQLPKSYHREWNDIRGSGQSPRTSADFVPLTSS